MAALPISAQDVKDKEYKLIVKRDLIARAENNSSLDRSVKSKVWFGWCLYDWANSAFATIILATVLPIYFVDLVPDSGAYLPFASHTVQASVLWSYCVAFSMLLVALSAPYLGSWADRLGAHRGMLGGFCLFGAIATCFLYLAQGNSYILAAVLFILANIGFALANIFYNSFLPILADKKGMDRLSARGFGLGYIGGGLALALVALLIYKHQFFGLENRAMAMRLGFLFTGIWWIVFALPSFLLLGKVKYPRRMSAIPPGLKGYFRMCPSGKRA